MRACVCVCVLVCACARGCFVDMVLNLRHCLPLLARALSHDDILKHELCIYMYAYIYIYIYIKI